MAPGDFPASSLPLRLSFHNSRLPDSAGKARRQQFLTKMSKGFATQLKGAGSNEIELSNRLQLCDTKIWQRWKGATMTITASVGALFSATYTARIQDALGNSGASLTLTEGNSSSTKITGNPTGSGLKILAGQSAARNTQAATDTVHLSPEAQRKFEEQTIALTLLNSTTASMNSNTPTNQVTIPNINKEITKPNLYSSEIDPTDVASLSQEDPSQVIKDSISAATNAISQISTNDGFYQTTGSDPDALKSFLSSFSATDSAAIASAYANKTLVVQSPENEPGWHQVDGTVSISGTTASFDGGRTGLTTAEAASSGKEYRSLNFGYGSLVVSWPKTTQSVS